MAAVCSVTKRPVCHCEEKDQRIHLLNTQLRWLQSEKLALKAANLVLREELDDHTRHLEDQLASKETEAQVLLGTCHAMSCQMTECEEKAAALQEELTKKEELLRLNSSACWSLELLPSDELPESPKPSHDVSIQTSPRATAVPRTASADSLDSWPLSARSEVAPLTTEVQELRYTVQVLQEQLGEWQSAPNSPMYAPKWQMSCTSLADELDLNVTLQRLDVSSSILGSTVGSQLSLSFAQRFDECDLCECQALVDTLATPLSASEAMSRAAVGLEEECGRQALVMYSDWQSARRRLHSAGVAQLLALAAADRGRISHTEEMLRTALLAAAVDRAPHGLTSDNSSVGEDFDSLSSETLEHCEHLVEILSADESHARPTAEPLSQEDCPKNGDNLTTSELWETEQWTFFSGWRPGRPHFSDPAGRPVHAPPSDTPIAGCDEPSGGWQLDTSAPSDTEGWQYQPMLTLPTFQSVPWLAAPTRRRKWVRAAESRGAAVNCVAGRVAAKSACAHAIEVFGELIIVD
eukprot:EG_transcript_4228